MDFWRDELLKNKGYIDNNKEFGSRIRETWAQTAINLAFDIAGYRSEDPYTQVGACAIRRGGFQVFVGYNGAPNGVQINWKDRDSKNDRVIHAETNVLSSIFPGEVELLALTHLPCKICIKTIAQKAIPLVIYCIEMPPYEPELVKKLAKEFKIELIKMEPSTRNVPESLIYNR